VKVVYYFWFLREETIMNKNILVIFILILITTTVVSATHKNVKEKNQITSADVPIWKVGQSCTYNEQYMNHAYSEDGNLTWLWFHNCTSTYIVTDTAGDDYTVKMITRKNRGSSMLGPFQLKFTPFTKLKATFKQRKTDLAYIRESYTEKGLVFLLVGKIGLPIPLHFRSVWGGSYSPPGIILPFPLVDGKSGTIANYTLSGHMKMSFLRGLLTLVDEDYWVYARDQNYTCELEQVTVPAGTYDVFNVSTVSTYGLGNSTTWSYYSPEVGWFAKQYVRFEDEFGRPGWIFKCELVSTTYNT
jgi:hypothetical protein